MFSGYILFERRHSEVYGLCTCGNLYTMRTINGYEVTLKIQIFKYKVNVLTYVFPFSVVKKGSQYHLKSLFLYRPSFLSIWVKKLFRYQFHSDYLFSNSKKHINKRIYTEDNYLYFIISFTSDEFKRS